MAETLSPSASCLYFIASLLIAGFAIRWHYPFEEHSEGIGKLIFNNGIQNGALIWDDLRIFLAIARSGALNRAAEELGLGLATVSRRAARLEGALGAALFIRQQSGCQLTAEGEALLAEAEAMESAARAVSHAVTDANDISGVVRLATAENLATGLIIPALGALRKAHPQLRIEIVTDIRAANIHRRDADIALRMIRPEQGDLTLQKLGVLGFALYGAPGAALTDEMIGWDEAFGHLPAAKLMKKRMKGRKPAITTTSLAAQIAGCAAGLGLAVLPHFLARRHGLIRLAETPEADQEIWLVTHAALSKSRRVSVVAEFLRDLVARHRADLAGTE